MDPSDLHLATIWELVADTVPEQAAVVRADERLTWRDYDLIASKLATGLASLGAGRDTRIALFLHNSPAYLIAQFAAFKLRAVPVNVNYRYTGDELAHLLDDSDAQIVIADASLVDRVAHVRGRSPGLRAVITVDDGADVPGWALDFHELIEAHDPHPRLERSGEDLYMFYTGGTTGLPRGVLFRHGPFCARALRNLPLFDITPPRSPDDLPDVVRSVAEAGGLRALPASPLMHGTGVWVGAMLPHDVGGCVVLLPGRSLDADELLSTIERERVDLVVIVGDAFGRPILRALEAAEERNAPYDLSSLRLVFSSGAMWSADVKAALLERVDATLVDALASTEGGGYGMRITRRGETTTTASFELGAGTRVVTEDGRDVVPGSGEAGLLASATAAIGYHKDPERTARTFRVIDGQHYVVTGDWARVGHDGSIELIGRGSQCINTGGEKVFPEEVEAAIVRHPAIDDCLVLGVPHERLGQQVVAVVAAAPGKTATEAELRAWVRDQLAGYKVPKHIVVSPTIRRAPNGKADYGWAREEYERAL